MKLFKLIPSSKVLSLLVLTIALLGFHPELVNAQSTIVGAKGGLNFSWFGGEDWNDLIDSVSGTGFTTSNEIKTDFFAGGFVEFRNSPRFSTQIELLFGAITGGISQTDSNNKYEFTMRARVLNVPILLKPRFPIDNQSAMYMLVGPELGLVLGDLRVRERLTGFGSATTNIEPDQRFFPSLTLGLGFERPILTGILYSEVRYNLGFPDVFEELIINTNSINLFVGYGVRR